MDYVQAFNSSGLASRKRAHFLEIYESAFAEFRNRPVRVVEVGVASGGSLETLARFFGQQAQIIGVDVRLPEISRATLEAIEKETGAKIDVVEGDAAKPDFWKSFYSQYGSPQIFVDDGGHTNEQQIVAAFWALKNVSPGGLIVCEDTECSLMPSMGNPSRHSFLSWVNFLAEGMNRRLLASPGSSTREQMRSIDHISVFPGIALIKIEAEPLETDVLDNGGLVTVEFGSTMPSVRFPGTSPRVSARVVTRFQQLNGAWIQWLFARALGSIRRIRNLKLRLYFRRTD